MHAVGFGNVDAALSATDDLLVPDHAVAHPPRMHGATIAQHHGHNPFRYSTLPHAHLRMISERQIGRKLTGVG